MERRTKLLVVLVVMLWAFFLSGIVYAKTISAQQSVNFTYAFQLNIDPLTVDLGVINAGERKVYESWVTNPNPFPARVYYEVVSPYWITVGVVGWQEGEARNLAAGERRPIVIFVQIDKAGVVPDVTPIEVKINWFGD